MRYGPGKKYDWLLFIFFLTSYTIGVLGFWGNAAPYVGTGMAGASAGGDVMKLQIKKVSDDGNVDKNIFKTFG